MRLSNSAELSIRSEMILYRNFCDHHSSVVLLLSCHGGNQVVRVTAFHIEGRSASRLDSHHLVGNLHSNKVELCNFTNKETKKTGS